MSDTSIDTRTALGTTNTKSTTSDFLSEAKSRESRERLQSWER